MQLAIASHQAFINALIIDQVAYRLPHFDIVEVRIFHAHRQVVDRSFSYRINGEVGVVPQGAHVGDRHVAGDIQIAFLHHQPQGLRLLQMAEHHPRHLRLAAPVISRTTHAQHIFCLPYIQPERAGARFMGGEPAVAPVAIHLMLLHSFAVQHHHAAQRRQRVDHQLRIVRSGQGDHQRVVVGRGNHLVNVVAAEAVRFPHRRLRQVQMQHPPHRPDRIGAGERIAGVKSDVVAQVKSQGAVIRTD